MARIRALSHAQEAARREAEAVASARHMAENVLRVRDSAIEAGQWAWRAVRITEVVRDRAQEDAERKVACITELENALVHQATTHSEIINTLTVERDELRTQVGEVREGMLHPPLDPLRLGHWLLALGISHFTPAFRRLPGSSGGPSERESYGPSGVPEPIGCDYHWSPGEGRCQGHVQSSGLDRAEPPS